MYLKFVSCIQILLNLQVYLDFLAGRGISDSRATHSFLINSRLKQLAFILAVVSLAPCFEFLEPPCPQADPLENLMGMNGGLSFDGK